MDIDAVRSELLTLRGQWSKVALAAGVNRKTIARFVADSDYNPTFATMRALSGAIEQVRGQSLPEKAA